MNARRIAKHIAKRLIEDAKNVRMKRRCSIVVEVDSNQIRPGKVPMNRSFVVGCVTILFAVGNIVAQTSTPAPPPDTPKDAAGKAPQQDPGVRKLSRRELKDRISKLP